MWRVSREGSHVLVCEGNGDLVAVVGEPGDFRVNRKLNTARMVAAAPEMLEVLIDMNELLRREFFVDDHPILQSVKKRCADLINTTMKPYGGINGEKRKKRRNNRANSSREHTVTEPPLPDLGAWSGEGMGNSERGVFSEQSGEENLF